MGRDKGGECRWKTLGCRANARNVREATHAPRKPIPVQTAHGLPLPHPSDTHSVSPSASPQSPPLGYTRSYTLVLLLFHVCNAISCNVATSRLLSFPWFYSYSHCYFFFFLYFFFLFFFCVFPTFFHPNSTLTHRKMPIRNVSSEKEKLKLAKIFFHAGSCCLPLSLCLFLSLCLSLSQSHPYRGIVSFHFLLIFHLKWAAGHSCHVPHTRAQWGEVAPTPARQIAAAELPPPPSPSPSSSRGFQFTRLRPAHPFSVCPSSWKQLKQPPGSGAALFA